MAVSGGQVAWSSLSSSAGNWIGIDHGNGIYSVYMHMSSRLVKEGDYVTAGQNDRTGGKYGQVYRTASASEYPSEWKLCRPTGLCIPITRWQPEYPDLVK